MAVHGYILLTPGSTSVTGTSHSVTPNGEILFTSISALNVNNIFSVEYDNYMIISQYKGSGALNLTMQLRASGTPSNTKYTYQTLTVDNVTVTGSRSQSQSSMAINTTAGLLTCSSIIYVYKPFTTSSTAFRVSSCSDTSSAYMFEYGGQHAIDAGSSPGPSTLYDGFNINTSTGTITGTMAIYGAKK